MLVDTDIQIIEQIAQNLDDIFKKSKVFLGQIALKQTYKGIQYDFNLIVLQLSLRLTNFIQLFANILQLLLFISYSTYFLTFLYPFLPLLVLEFLHLHIGFHYILRCFPHAYILCLCLISQPIVMLNLFAGEVLLRVFRELSISVTDNLLLYYHPISLSLYFSKDIDLLLIMFRACDCKLNKLPFQLLFEVILGSFPHLLGMDVAEANQLQFGKVEGDVLQVRQVNQLQLETLDFTHEALQDTIRIDFTTHVLFGMRVRVQCSEFLLLQKQSAFLELLSDLAAVFPIQSIFQSCAINGWKEMLVIFAVGRLGFDFEYGCVMNIADDELERGDYL